MELYEMLYQRLIGSEKLAGLLTKYKGKPAIFYQHAATADDPKWGDHQRVPQVETGVVQACRCGLYASFV